MESDLKRRACGRFAVSEAQLDQWVAAGYLTETGRPLLAAAAHATPEARRLAELYASMFCELHEMWAQLVIDDVPTPPPVAVLDRIYLPAKARVDNGPYALMTVAEFEKYFEYAMES